MKKYFLLLFILAIPALLISQTVSEAIKEAEKLFVEKSYRQSMQKLDKAKKEIEIIYLDELRKELLPTNIKGYIVKDNNSAIVQSFVSGDNVQVVQIYSSVAQVEEGSNIEHREMIIPKTISINISNAPNKVFEVSESYLFSRAGEEDPLMPSPIEFKEYRSIIQYDQEMQEARFAAIIGAATIEIISRGIENKDEILEIANTVNLKKIIKIFGK